MNKLISYLEPYGFTHNNQYGHLDCPACGKSKKAFVYLDDFKCYGTWTYITCNSCSHSTSIRDLCDVVSLPPNPAKKNVEHETFKAYEKHGLDFWGLMEQGVIGGFGDIRLGECNGRTARLELFNKKNKLIWKVPTKKLWNRGQKSCFIFPIRPKRGPLYIMAGIWDWLKGFQDGLCCTSSIYGEGTLPSENDWHVFVEYQKIIICYDQDRAGKKGASKLFLSLREKFPDKEVFIVNLPFSDEEIANKQKDYCDYRKKHSVNEFLQLGLIQPSVNKTKKELAAEKRNARIENKIRLSSAEAPMEIIDSFEENRKLWIVAKNGIFCKEEIVDYGKATGKKICKRILPHPITIKNKYRDIFAGNVFVFLSWNHREEVFEQIDISFSRNISKLAKKGIYVSDLNASALVEYFQAALARLADEKSIASQNGWISQDQFVLGNKIITADEHEDIKYTGEAYIPITTGEREDWIAIIDEFKNDVQITMKLAACAISPFIKKIGCTSFAEHTWNDTSCGKSTGSYLAASMIGNPRQIVEDWRQTRTGLETLFEEAGGLSVFLEESQKADPKSLEQAIYDFANGKGMGRGTIKNGEIKRRKAKTFFGVLHSTGEEAISQKTNLGGILSRLVEIFREPPEFNSKMETVIESAMCNLDDCHGHIMPEIIQYGIIHEKKLRELYKELLKDIREKTFDNPISRRKVKYYSAILVGHHILTEIGVPVASSTDVEKEIFKQMTTEKPKNRIEKVLEIIESLVVSNHQKFCKKQGPHISECEKDPLWGRIDFEKDRKIVHFLPLALKDQLIKEGFDMSIMTLLKKAGKLEMTEENRVQNRISIEGRKERVYSIVLEN